MSADDVLSVAPLLLSLVAIGVSFCALVQNRKMEKIRHTHDFVRDYNNDDRIDRAHQFLRNIQDISPDEAISLYGNSGHRADFLFLMNQFEILAIGLKKGIYDKNFIYNIFGNEIYRSYYKSERLINHIRECEKVPRAFKELEYLATSDRLKHLKST